VPQFLQTREQSLPKHRRQPGSFVLKRHVISSERPTPVLLMLICLDMRMDANIEKPLAGSYYMKTQFNLCAPLAALQAVNAIRFIDVAVDLK